MKTLNASTGPRSAEGKTRSSMNALKSGIYSNSLTIPGEDPAISTHSFKSISIVSTPLSRAARPGRYPGPLHLDPSPPRRREAQVYIYQMDSLSKPNSKAPLGRAFRNCDQTLARLQRIVNSTQRNFATPSMSSNASSPSTLPPRPSRSQLKPNRFNPSRQFVSSTPISASGTHRKSRPRTTSQGATAISCPTIASSTRGAAMLSPEEVLDTKNGPASNRQPPDLDTLLDANDAFRSTCHSVPPYANPFLNYRIVLHSVGSGESTLSIPRVRSRCLLFLGFSLAVLPPFAPAQSLDARLYSKCIGAPSATPRRTRASAIRGSQPTQRLLHRVR